MAKAWKLSGKELSHVVDHARANFSNWRPFELQPALIQLGRHTKPAVFVVVSGSEYKAWTTSVEPRGIAWQTHTILTEPPYPVLQLSIEFEDEQRGPIGIQPDGVTVTTSQLADTVLPRLRCNALIDPAGPGFVEAWAGTPGTIPVFIVDHEFTNLNYVTMQLTAAEKQVALAALAEATAALPSQPTAGAYESAVTAGAELGRAQRW